MTIDPKKEQDKLAVSDACRMMLTKFALEKPKRSFVNNDSATALTEKVHFSYAFAEAH